MSFALPALLLMLSSCVQFGPMCGDAHPNTGPTEGRASDRRERLLAQRQSLLRGLRQEREQGEDALGEHRTDRASGTQNTVNDAPEKEEEEEVWTSTSWRKAGLLHVPLRGQSSEESNSRGEHASGVFVLLLRDEVNSASVALHSLWLQFNHAYAYPVVIFHEGHLSPSSQLTLRQAANGVLLQAAESTAPRLDLDPDLAQTPPRSEQKRSTHSPTAAAASVVVRFANVRDQMDPSLLLLSGTRKDDEVTQTTTFDLSMIPAQVEGFSKSSVGYRAMCRFFAGAYLRHPALQSFRYAWRIDSDSVYTCPVRYDVFARMRDAGWAYGWNVLYYEAPTIAGRTLWQATQRFCRMHPRLGENALHAVDPLISWWGDYSRCHYWNNFEVMDMDHFRVHTPYLQYFDYLDAQHGFWLYRWGDALVRTLGVHLFLRPQQVHRFDDIGYSHQHYCLNPCGATTPSSTSSTGRNELDQAVAAYMRCERELDSSYGIGEHCSWWEQRTRDTEPSMVFLLVVCLIPVLLLIGWSLYTFCALGGVGGVGGGLRFMSACSWITSSCTSSSLATSASASSCEATSLGSGHSPVRRVHSPAEILAKNL